MTVFSIGETARITGVKIHILRYWENTLPFIRPQMNVQGRRFYTFRNLDFIFRIRYLTAVKHYSLAKTGERLLTDLSLQPQRDAEKIAEVRKELVLAYHRLLQLRDTALCSGRSGRLCPH